MIHSSRRGAEVRGTVHPPGRTALHVVLFTVTAVSSVLLFMKGWDECATKYRREFDEYEPVAGFGFTFGIIPLIVMLVFVAAALTWTLLALLDVRRAAGLALLTAALTCGAALLIVHAQYGGSIFDPATYVVRPLASIGL